MARLAPCVVGAALFSLLATQNSAGYRYGVQDQSFYIPAIERHLDPTLYPHDSAVLDAQDQFLAFDNGTAGLVRVTGWPLPAVFLGAQLVTLLLLFAGTVGIGRTLYRSWLTVAGLAFAMTLRHQITDTSVNTLEGYFHPRMLAFSIGVTGLLLFLRGRSWPALAVAAVAGLLHPMIGFWFVIWLGAATAVADPHHRQLLGGAALLGLATVAVMLFWGPLERQLVVMDDTWLAALVSKDYLFANDWPWTTWVVNLGYGATIGAVYWYRRSTIGVPVQETGLVVGCGVLLAIFILSVPFVAAGVALAVQTQISRMFWMLDFFCTIYVVWLLVENPSRPRWGLSASQVRYAGLAVLAVAAIARGSYVMWVENPERPLIETRIPSSDWQRVMAWSARTAPGTNLLVDPGHAWRYGSSVRVAGRRDVYLEEVKDTGMAIFSNPVARRVAERIQDLGDFTALTATTARALARKYDLHYLITTHQVDLEIIHRSGPFVVYDLES
ncbi:MAG: hypothetical protein QF681_16570 [Vicinamibacterales bacterium]|jgi:hypothetical protein|nr:hypothetical protein [Vicinamibacterales bacterium]